MRIGIVLPSRGRPEGLKRMVASLLDTATKPDRVTIFAGLDDDDPTLPQIEGIARVERVIRSPEITVAKTIDNLALEAESRCDATIRMDDDFICGTRGWDDNAECMTGLGLWLPDDPTHPGHFMSFAAMSSQMAGWIRKRQGFVHAPWFPFWFTDTWLNEIADMSSAKGVLDMTISQPDGRGKTHGLRDIKFWTQMFEGFRVFRKRMAAMLIHDLYPDGILKRTALMKLAERERICEMMIEKMYTPEFLAAWESRSETFSGTSDVRYRKAKADAEAMIAEAVEQERAA